MHIDFHVINGLDIINTRFKKTVDLESTRRWKAIPVGLHTGETLNEERCEGCADTGHWTLDTDCACKDLLLIKENYNTSRRKTKMAFG
jgi:hypothetical protein